MIHDETNFADRVRSMTAQHQRVLTEHERKYMRTHDFAHLSAGELHNLCAKRRVDISNLHHRIDILRALDAKKKK